MAFERPPEPRATKSIIIACIAVYLLQLFVRGPYIEYFFSLSARGLLAGRFWQLFTYQFLHGNELHLLLNMVALWFAGRELEHVLGTKRYLTLYFTGGVVGGLVQVLVYPNIPLIGASASVCAVLLCVTTLFPNVPITALIFFVLPLRMKARYLGYGLIASAVIFWVSGLQPNVGHAAHLGGFLTGWLFALYFRREAHRIGGRHSFGPQPNTFWKKISQSPVQEGQFEIVEEPPARTVDEVLDKVLREGIDSLTREERRILEGARRPRR